MANPNIINATSIYGKTAVVAVGTGATNLAVNSAASGKILKVNSLTIANVDGASSADITVEIFRSSVAYRIALTVPVPADSTLVVISRDNQIYLEEGDTLRALASASGDLEAVCSYEEIS